MPIQDGVTGSCRVTQSGFSLQKAGSLEVLGTAFRNDYKFAMRDLHPPPKKTSVIPGSVDSKLKYEDLSGIDTSAYKNPYDAIIDTCQNDPSLIQSRYVTHRTTRNSQQRTKLLSPSFSGLILDPILQRLVDPSIEPGFTDPRNCLVFWARPPNHIRTLAGQIQEKLSALAPGTWLMPLPNMHLTALEITHSLTDSEIGAFLTALGPEIINQMTDFTYNHRARLIKPTVSYDSAALALSFVPASGEGLISRPSTPTTRSKEADDYTYHHLRRDIFNIASEAGVSVDSRYVVPSSHITLARFLHQKDLDTSEKMAAFIKKIEEINTWLEEEFWPREGDERGSAGEWIVGQDKGLECRAGTLWYGGGRQVRLGLGFPRD